MWNLKYDTNELIYKTETDLPTQRADSCAKGKNGRGGVGCGGERQVQGGGDRRTHMCCA